MMRIEIAGLELVCVLMVMSEAAAVTVFEA